jgi:hypothetical protein
MRLVLQMKSREGLIIQLNPETPELSGVCRPVVSGCQRHLPVLARALPGDFLEIVRGVAGGHLRITGISQKHKFMVLSWLVGYRNIIQHQDPAETT